MESTEISNYSSLVQFIVKLEQVYTESGFLGCGAKIKNITVYLFVNRRKYEILIEMKKFIIQEESSEISLCIKHFPLSLNNSTSSAS